ncbi:hypothetical protein KKA24_01780 [Patescibacteria group bacterium]|nr:hypothetical protein [Patescibacteria group bacterium]
MEKLRELTKRDEICATTGGDEELIRFIEEKNKSIFEITEEKNIVNESHPLLDVEIAFHGCKRSGVFNK